MKFSPLKLRGCGVKVYHYRMAYELDKDGYIGLPPGPGLGVEVDEARLAAEAKKPQTYRWPGAKLKDGSVADY